MIETALRSRSPKHAGAEAGDGAGRRCGQAVGRGAPPGELSTTRWAGCWSRLQNAFYHLAAGRWHVEPALIGTVGCGGDTDTNAAIAGALLGAADGRSALPMRWVMPVLTCRPDPGLHPHRPRPDEYWADDLVDLTEALLLSHPR